MADTTAPTIDQRPRRLPRPQPVGIFPLPAGYLLIGADPDPRRGPARARRRAPTRLVPAVAAVLRARTRR